MNWNHRKLTNKRLVNKAFSVALIGDESVAKLLHFFSQWNFTIEMICAIGFAQLLSPGQFPQSYFILNFKCDARGVSHEISSKRRGWFYCYWRACCWYMLYSILRIRFIARPLVLVAILSSERLSDICRSDIIWSILRSQIWDRSSAYHSSIAK